MGKTALVPGAAGDRTVGPAGEKTGRSHKDVFRMDEFPRISEPA